MRYSAIVGGKMDRTQFYDEIDKIILGLVKKQPDFYFLMKSKKGIHPIDIKLSLQRLYKKKKISAALFRKITISAKNKGKVVSEDDNLLPVPHLLDYDWRFSIEGIETMISLINRNNKYNNAVIAFIGTPSLFKMFFSKQETKNQYILIDKNADKHIQYIIRCTKNFSFKKYDIMTREPINVQADLVVMDPPWYLTYNKLFFQFAESMVKINGKIICVLPPKYTRKSIEDELQELEQFINDLGIEKEHYYKNVVTYNTPPFERNALRENGIYCMPKGWRTGDVLIAKKVSKSTAIQSPIIISETGWEEINIGMVRYKLKTDFDLEIKSFNLSIESVFKNDIYPSVKRSRTKEEKTINVWTSGNRVFYCNNIPLLYYILLEHSVRYKHYDINICDKIEWGFNIKLSEQEKAGISKCVELIKTINKKEYQEYGKWGKLA